MNEKNETRKEVHHTLIRLLESTLDILELEIAEARQLAAQYGYYDLRLEVDYSRVGEDIETYACIVGTRRETDMEIAARLNTEATQRIRRQEYERLRAEFEGDGGTP